MDTDLYQILTLILLLGLLLTLFGVLQSLGAIRKTLEGRGNTTPAESSPAAQPASGLGTSTLTGVATPAPAAGVAAADDEQPATWAHPTRAEEAAAEVSSEPETEPEPDPEPARTGWPSPQETTASGASVAAAIDEPASVVEEPAEPSAGASSSPAGGGARVLYGDSGLTTATPSESALRPSESAEPEPEPAGAAGAAASGAAEDPQEQPFERDGRWWFRRGDELLVYEEQTGQWVAAGPSTSGSVAASAPGQAQATSGTSAGAAEGQVTTQQEAVGSFWKCPSCGAVNGSTATSCRMCFTARP